jgi:asparagine synthase (glutamine-hydrolysing)
MTTPRLLDLFQEFAELGPGGLTFRVWWEAKQRTGLGAALETAPRPPDPRALPDASFVAKSLPFEPSEVRDVMRDRLGAGERARLAWLAACGAEGRIFAFGRSLLDFGSPPDFYLNPVNGRRWDRTRHWSRALREERRVGDVKLTWEIGRFPHAYLIARAATYDPRLAEPLGHALADQVASFVEATGPFGKGIHWNSGQEIVFRCMAWLFAVDALGPDSVFRRVAPVIGRTLYQNAVHVERHLSYTVNAVYNNHLLSEALGLLLAGMLLPGVPQARRWVATGLAILTEQADRQFYADGGYIQLSHNYERVALQVYLWALALRRYAGEPVPGAWVSALDRAVAFLHAQQNPADGRLPNYGPNDGALPSPLTCCDYADFRPTLQAASIAARGERLYPPGPWDEEAAWLLGASSLGAPLQPRTRASASFAMTGFHVLRGRDEGTFSMLRCGTIRDRFSQIDMLHLDVWWRGENVLVDAGTYLYNGPASWHAHFADTGCHNTVLVDRRDQMLHHRRFKNLYWTRADLLRFEDAPTHAIVEGEHHGYARHPGGCVHRRAVLFAKDDLWIVADRIGGEGVHSARVHWLGGDYAHEFDERLATMSLATPAGEFQVAVRDERGDPVPAEVVRGRGSPPRGWLSRYYAEKRPVPSLTATQASACPIQLVSLLSAGPVEVHVSSGEWSVEAAGVRAYFRLTDGRFDQVRVELA